MSLRLEEQQVRVETFIASNTGQTLAEGLVQIPDDLPAVGEVLNLRGVAQISEVVVNPGTEELMINGIVHLQMLYGMEGGDTLPVYSVQWPEALSFSQRVEVPGVDSKAQVMGTARVENIDFSLSEDGRELELEAVVYLTGEARQVADLEIISSAQATGVHKAKGESKNISIQDQVTRDWFEASVEGQLTLPEAAVEILRVIEVSPQPIVETISAKQGQAVISGSINYRILYWGEEEGQESIYRVNVSSATSFEFALDVEGLQPDMEVTPKCRATLVQVTHKEKDSLNVKVDLEIFLKSFKKKQLGVLNDLVGEGELVQTRKEIVGIDQFVAQLERQTVVDRTLGLPAQEEAIQQILYLEVEPVVDGVTVGAGKITIEGEAFLKIVYLTAGEGTYPLGAASWGDPLPFTVHMDAPGTHPGMNAQVELVVTESKASLINEEQISIECSINTKVDIYESLEEEVVVECVGIEPQVSDPPSITFVVVQEKDTLWKLSRRYHTSEESIIQANPWLQEQEEAHLQKGWKLFIPRRKAQSA